MEKCWSTNPSDRPSFASLKDALEFLYEDAVHKVSFDHMLYYKLIILITLDDTHH